MGDRGETTALQVRFWGVRGSYPAPGPATVKIGGNSSCVEMRAGAHRLIFDAGTGIIGLGKQMLSNGNSGNEGVVHIFLSHFHHDHIEGLRYFDPAYRPNWECNLYGPGSGGPIERTLAQTMQTQLFPVALAELPARLEMHTLGEDETVRFDGSPALTVRVRFSKAHPKVGVMLYRVEFGGHAVVYATDVESPKGGYEDVVDLARGADLLIHDSQYTDAEYFDGHSNKAGWGHSTVRMAAEAAQSAGVGKLVLYHHDPQHDDKTVRDLERLAQSIFANSQAAYEGLELRI